MRTSIFVFLFILLTIRVVAQQNVGIGTLTPNLHSILELQSADKGFLLPRLSTVQRLAISPIGLGEKSLLVFDTDDNLFYYWDGTQWIGFPQTSISGLNTSFVLDTLTNTLSITDAGSTLTVNLNNVLNNYTAGAGISIVNGVISNTGDLSTTNELITNVGYNLNTGDLSITEAGNLFNVNLNSLKDVYTAGAGIGIANNVITNTGDLSNTNEVVTAFTFNSGNNILTLTEGGNSFTADLSGLTNNDWKLLGNAGTNPAVNFLGTTDGQPVVFKSQNTEVMRITPNGRVGINNSAPDRTFDMFGDGAKFTGTGTVYIASGAITAKPGLELFTTNNIGYIRHHDPGVNWYDISIADLGGQVAIGTDVFSTDALLYVDGGIRTLTGPPVNNGATNTGYSFDADGDTGLFAEGVTVGTNVELNLYLNNVKRVSVSGGITSFQTDLHPVGTNRDLGDATATWRNIYLTNNPIVSSDVRLKTNIETLSSGLKAVLALRPVSYTLKNSVTDSSEKLGFIAQEVKEILPCIVHGSESENSFLSVSYSELIPVLTKAIQEQQEHILYLSKETQLLSGQVKNLEMRLNASSSESGQLSSMQK